MDKETLESWGLKTHVCPKCDGIMIRIISGWYCFDCGQFFFPNGELIKLPDEKQLSTQCIHCGKPFSESEQNGNANMENMNLYNCVVCNKTFKNKIPKCINCNSQGKEYVKLVSSGRDEMEIAGVRWNEETKTLTISWVDLEHIAGDEGWRENLECELEIRGINVSLADIEHIVINVQEKVIVVPNPDGHKDVEGQT